MVEVYFSIIENKKKTDSVTMRQKIAAWERLSVEYNSENSFAYCSAENQKAAWENFKKSCKRDAANVRVRGLQDRYIQTSQVFSSEQLP